MVLVVDTGPLLAALDAGDPPKTGDVVRAAALGAQYADLDFGFVDAVVIAVCERLGEPKIATLDRRHFGTVRPSHCERLRLLPEPQGGSRSMD